MARTRFLLAEQAQFSIASGPIFWQTISHDSVFHRWQPQMQADYTEKLRNKRRSFSFHFSLGRHFRLHFQTNSERRHR